jgi:hypothetical protein
MKRVRAPQPPTPTDTAAAIAALDRIARQATAGTSWRTTVLMLTDRAYDESRSLHDRYRDQVSVGRIMRDAGALDHDEAFFHLASAIMGLAPEPADHPELRRLSAEMAAFNRAEGLADDEYWPLGEGPDDYEALRVEWDRVHDQTIADTFRAYDEVEMADLYQNDNNTFHRRYDRGRKKIFGPLPDDVAAVLRAKELID